MAMEFGVLASGSSGNAAVLTWRGQGVLIDLGIGPRSLAMRLDRLGLAWGQIRAAVLTHVHADHWSERTLEFLGENRIPLYCHASQGEWLRAASAAFAELARQGLVREYVVGQALEPVPGLRCRPVELSHDSRVTCGFRFEGQANGHGAALAYLTDLGVWTEQVAEQAAQVDVLALEFNHDVRLERGSGRTPELIARVLGQGGHLSNEQAAELVRAALARSTPGRLRHLVQLHLSRQCNRPALAVAAVKGVAGNQVTIHTARQKRPGPLLRVQRPQLPPVVQGCLPGWESAVKQHGPAALG